MDPNYIRPFIASVQNVFTTMLQLPVTVGAPTLKQTPGVGSDISGIIGMSGDVVGTVILSFPKEPAERVVALFTGTKLEAGTPDFADAIGELVNMISGGAKAMFSGKKASISCPSVIIGAHHNVAIPSDTPCVSIPCTTDCGTFMIDVAIREAGAATKSSATAANTARS
jgi:chemotaxis protein CheX